MLSTTVSIEGKVDSTLFGESPTSKGVYFFGSNVSVCAMPPAIQRTMTLSAVGTSLAADASSAKVALGNDALSAASAAAEAVLRKSRRDQSLRACICLPDELEFRQHNDCPEEILDALRRHVRPDDLLCRSSFARRGRAAERL